VGRALGEKFLSELQCIAFRPISRLEQPTAKAGLYDMHDVACGGDPRLRQENLVVLNRHHADCVAIGGSLPELNCGNLANRHWKLHEPRQSARPRIRASDPRASRGVAGSRVSARPTRRRCIGICGRILHRCGDRSHSSKWCHYLGGRRNMESNCASNSRR